MASIEQVGHDEVLGRDLFLLSIPSPQDMPRRLSVTTAKFACLIAWDARSARVEEVSAIARQLLDAGAVYVCVWGPGCERVHDIFDKERDGPNPLTGTDPVVMTTWHHDESLAEVLGFILASAITDDGFTNECGATLGVAIGSAEWANAIRDAFSRPFTNAIPDHS